jgi:MYXO-CTERM domain-containing protein
MRGRAGRAIDQNVTAVAFLRRFGLALERAARALQATSALLLLTALLAFAVSASAQTSTLSTITSPNGSIVLNPQAQGIDRERDYYSAARPWWISYEDCLANDVFTFNLTIRDTTNPLEIWAGTENCATNRSRTDRGQCWIVAREPQLSDTIAVKVPVRNILLRQLDTTNPPAAGLSNDVCDDSTDPSGEAVTFYIMLVDGGQADEYIAWDGGTGLTGFDVVGPDPPGSIDVGIGESQLAVDINGVDEDTDRESFEAFCVPAGTTFASLGLQDPDAVETPGSDAGAGVLDGGLDAGQITPVSAEGDAGGAAPSACFTEVLRSGRRALPQFGCGTVRETSSSLRTSRLVNDTQYAVAVSARDNLGNAGVVSTIECGRPTQLDDFFELYSRADGKGGGGFCSVAPGATATSPRNLAVLLVALAGLALRRKRGVA